MLEKQSRPLSGLCSCSRPRKTPHSLLHCGIRPSHHNLLHGVEGGSDDKVAAEKSNDDGDEEATHFKERPVFCKRWDWRIEDGME